jgi:hypothetical protein
MITLRKPALADLPQDRRALEAGYSPNNLDPEHFRHEIAQIEADAAGFVASLDDPAAKRPPIRLPRGTLAPRLPGFWRWIFGPDFAAASACAGSPAPKPCRRMCLAISATVLSPRNVALGLRPQHWA